MLPALGYLTTDGPVLWAELSQLLKNADHTLRLGSIADAKTALEMDIFNPAGHLASQMVSLPVMVMLGSFKPAVATLFNGIVLVLAATELARLCRVNVGWHNVVFVATGASKEDVLPQVLAKDSKLPSGIVTRTGSNVVWFVDSAAAAKL